ncbi:MAG: hypothetical protein ACTS9Y_00490 [Methylophilus sp.]|uniref:hypothetical protein n=1 Tax=Methylophilus sp. TaxID=29541 RepID=UPI003F9F79CC
MAEQRTLSETSGNLFFSFKVEDKSGNPIYDQVEAAKRYWLKDDTDKWVFTVNEVAARLGLEPQDVPGHAAGLVHACLNENDTLCSNCEVSEPLVTREDYQNVRRFFEKTGIHVCQVCMNNDPEAYLQSTTKELKKHPLIKSLNAFVDDRNKVTSLTTRDYHYPGIDAFDAMYLHGLLVANKASWKGKTFKIKMDNMHLVHPYPDAMWDIVEGLQEKGIIFPMLPNVDLDLIIDVGIKDSVGADDFQWSLATTNPNIREITDVLSILDGVFMRACTHDQISVKKLFGHAALGEVLSCLIRKSIGLNVDEEELECDTIFTTLIYALSFYSIGQVKKLLYFVMREVQTKQGIGSMDADQTVKLIADTLRSTVDDSYNGGETIEPVERLNGEQATIISSLLFNKILKCGTIGYLSWSSKSVDDYLESRNRR